MSLFKLVPIFLLISAVIFPSLATFTCFSCMTSVIVPYLPLISPGYGANIFVDNACQSAAGIGLEHNQTCDTCMDLVLTVDSSVSKPIVGVLRSCWNTTVFGAVPAYDNCETVSGSTGIETITTKICPCSGDYCNGPHIIFPTPTPIGSMSTTPDSGLTCFSCSSMNLKTVWSLFGGIPEPAVFSDTCQYVYVPGIEQRQCLGQNASCFIASLSLVSDGTPATSLFAIVRGCTNTMLDPLALDANVALPAPGQSAEYSIAGGNNLWPKTQSSNIYVCDDSSGCNSIVMPIVTTVDPRTRMQCFSCATDTAKSIWVDTFNVSEPAAFLDQCQYANVPGVPQAPCSGSCYYAQIGFRSLAGSAPFKFVVRGCDADQLIPLAERLGIESDLPAMHYAKNFTSPSIFPKSDWTWVLRCDESDGCNSLMDFSTIGPNTTAFQCYSCASQRMTSIYPHTWRKPLIFSANCDLDDVYGIPTVACEPQQCLTIQYKLKNQNAPESVYYVRECVDVIPTTDSEHQHLPDVNQCNDFIDSTTNMNTSLCLCAQSQCNGLCVSCNETYVTPTPSRNLECFYCASPILKGLLNKPPISLASADSPPFTEDCNDPNELIEHEGGFYSHTKKCNGYCASAWFRSVDGDVIGVVRGCGSDIFKGNTIQNVTNSENAKYFACETSFCNFVYSGGLTNVPFSFFVLFFLFLFTNLCFDV